MAEYDFLQFNEMSEQEYSNALKNGYIIVSWDGFFGHKAILKKLKSGGQDINVILGNMQWIGDDLYIDNKPITHPDNANYLQDIANAGYTYAELKKKHKEQQDSKLDSRKYYSNIPDFLQPQDNKPNLFMPFLVVVSVIYIFWRYFK